MADNKTLIDLNGEAIIFYHVALLHGFRAAASHLGLSKSVVSSKVSSLESRIGRKLLYRSTRDVNLTPEGEIYFENCKLLLAATQKLQLSETEFKTNLSGTFTISAPHDFMIISLIPAVQKLHSLHPKLRLNLLASDQVANLEQSKIDLAIRVGADGAGHLYRTNFFTVDFGFYCKSSLAPVKKSEREILDWVQEEGAFVFRPSREKSFKLNDKVLDVKVQSKIQVNDVLSLKSLILAGAGIGILPKFAVSEELASGALTQLLPSSEFKQVTYNFFSGVRRQDDARLNAIIDFLKQEILTQ